MTLKIKYVVTQYTTGKLIDGVRVTWTVQGCLGEKDGKFYIRWSNRRYIKNTHFITEYETDGPFDKPSEAIAYAQRLSRVRDCYTHVLATAL